MIGSLHVKGFTVFKDAKFTFSPGLNVIIGENGTGKTQLLKLVYTLLATSHEMSRRPTSGEAARAAFEVHVGDRLFAVFRTEALGHLVHRRVGHAAVRMEGISHTGPIGVEVHAGGGGSVKVTRIPPSWEAITPVFFPTRELLSIYPGFVAMYESHILELEETWRDTCALLGAPLRRLPRSTVAPGGAAKGAGKRPKRPGGDLASQLTTAQSLVAPLEHILGGSLLLDTSGRFYLERGGVRDEMPLLSEGHRKVAMLARLIANGSLVPGTTLVWDEPEANLNPRVMKDVAKAIVGLVANGVQVIAATHSLFMMREFEILLGAAKPELVARWIGLQPGSDGVVVEQGDSALDLGAVAALDENLAQSDRFLEMEAKR